MKLKACLMSVVLLGALLTGCSESQVQKVDNQGQAQQQQNQQQQQQQPQVFKVGDTVQFDNLHITVHGARTSKGSEFEKPQQGKFLIVDVTVENKGNEPATVSQLMQTKLQDDQGRSYTPIIFSGAKGQLDGEVGPGRKLRGEVVFDVPNAAHYEFIFENPFTTGQAIWKIEGK
ncbi:MAG: hypothetical protein DIU76_11980 [Bacillota bacterium]|nr:MAG: hypothetical protein DIU76_11980 [Bacillota bacterium]